MTKSKMKKLPDIITEILEVKWSNLLKPDTAFGEGSANHNITVVMDKTLEKQLADLLKKSGAKKINGVYEKDGIKTFKAKSRVHLEAGKFPCVDAAANATDVVAFGGDKVRLRLAPAVVSRDNSLSLYLNGIQIVEKNTNGGGSAGFSAVDGGFVGAASKSSAPAMEDTEDSDLPF